MPNPPLPAALCVVGTGLIGGSLMRAAAPHLPVYGYARGEHTRQAATADGFDVSGDLTSTLRRADADGALVVLATPVTAFATILRAIDEAAPTVRLTDVGSVKGQVAAEVAALAPRARYLGSHPMTGTEHSGWQAGAAGLFSDRVWVTTLDDDSDIERWAPIAGLAVTIGSRVVPCDAATHDDAVARISHLPHLMAAALARVGAMGGPLALSLAAGSFADGTRVAATSPDLVRAMCEANAAPLIDAMDEALAQLGVARGSLASSGSLAKITSDGFASRNVFEQRWDHLGPTTLTGDDMVEQLLAVGAVGGYVTGVSGMGMSGAGADLTVAAMYPRDKDED